VRLRPCDVLAQVAPLSQHVAQFEVELAQRLADTGSPAAISSLELNPASTSVPASWLRCGPITNL
jgi:hypothetical protein